MAKLTADDPPALGYFGSSVSLSGDRAVIGAAYPHQGAVPATSSAYVFREVGETWPQVAKLDSAESYDLFGWDVAVSDNTAVIGTNYGFAGEMGGRTYVYDLNCETAVDCNENGVPDEDELEANDCDTNGILDVCEPHGISQVRSCAEHGVAGEFCVAIADQGIETRTPGPTFFEFDLTNIGCGLAVDAVINCEDNAYAGSATVTQVGEGTIRVALSPALADQDCCQITLSGSVQGTWYVRTLAGDADGNGTVEAADMTAIKWHLGQTAGPDNFLLDIDANGVINGADITAIKPRIGNQAGICP